MHAVDAVRAGNCSLVVDQIGGASRHIAHEIFGDLDVGHGIPRRPVAALISLPGFVAGTTVKILLYRERQIVAAPQTQKQDLVVPLLPGCDSVGGERTGRHGAAIA